MNKICLGLGTLFWTRIRSGRGLRRLLSFKLRNGDEYEKENIFARIDSKDRVFVLLCNNYCKCIVVSGLCGGESGAAKRLAVAFMPCRSISSVRGCTILA